MIKIAERKYKVIEEGSHVFKVTDVDYDAEFGKLIIKCATKDGLTHQERMNLLTKDGEVNEKVLGYFSYMARAILDLSSSEAQEIDEQDLVGHYFTATVKHEKREYQGKTYTNLRLSDYESADSFADEEDVDIDI